MKYTRVRLKVLKALTYHRTICWYSQHVYDINNIISNNRQSRRWFKFEQGKSKSQTSNETCDAQTKIPDRRTTEIV